ncbi:MAG: helix-turn-helix transcriptional regulator [Spirochaetes bacterium]|nr:helix-turn-helix transcriptional regulator [Spirochaetota bacterium]
MADIMIHEFLLGFIKIYILQCAAKEDVYGKEIYDQLHEHGYKLSYGTLYGTLHGFKEKGYLADEERNVQGKIRKYYRITERGREALEQAMDRARDLFTVIDR